MLLVSYKMFIFNYFSALAAKFELAWKRVGSGKRHLKDKAIGRMKPELLIGPRLSVPDYRYRYLKGFATRRPYLARSCSRFCNY